MSVQIRVHGVGRHEASGLLNGATERIPGTSGMHRLLGDPSLEAYVWSPLTHGSPSQRFWLLLTPFTLVNVGGYSHRGARETVPTRIYQLINKLLGALLVASLVVWVLRLGEVLFLRWFSGLRAAFFAAVLGGLWLLSIGVAARFRKAIRDPVLAEGDPPLTRPSFREWWSESPGNLARDFWRKSSGERREARDMVNLLLIFLFLGVVYLFLQSIGWREFQDWDELQLRFLVPLQVLLLCFIASGSLLGWLWAGAKPALFLRFLSQFVILTIATAFLYLVGAGLGSLAAPPMATMTELYLLDIRAAGTWWQLGILAVPLLGIVGHMLWGHRGQGPFRLARCFATLMTNLDALLAPVAVWFVVLVVVRLGSGWQLIPTDALENPRGLMLGRSVGVLALLAVGAVTLFPGIRPKLGMAWDALTFWPRFFHQLAPPPYAEQAVRELSDRIEGHVRAGQDVVVLGHSQGSVIAYAALLRLSDQVTSRVSLVTYGSPLGTLYGRFFPAYFKPQALNALPNRLRGGRNLGWRNFYRPTDYVGRQIFPRPTPETPAIDEEVSLGPELRRHSSYLETEEQVRAWVTARMLG